MTLRSPGVAEQGASHSERFRNGTTSAAAYEARVLVCITFHFRPARLVYLSDVLATLAEYPVAAMEVVVLTNTVDRDELALLDRLCRETAPSVRISVRRCEGMSHPKDLTWCHKPIISDAFSGPGDRRYSHFIYLEDDIRLSFANFYYFLQFRELLRQHRLLPAFVRTDFHAANGGLTATDAFFPVYVPLQPHLLLGEFAMVNMPNPYNPCFILDAELAQEYIRSASFDPIGSSEVCSWGVCERAAMGLCLENAPVPFQSRYVVPVARGSDTVPEMARIAHLPNNYANDTGSPLGKVRIDRLFKGAGLVGGDSWFPARPGGSSSGLRQGGFFLVTGHDTIVYWDEEGQRLSHGPFGVVPLNFLLAVSAKQGRLMIADTGAQGHAVSLTPAGEVRSASAAEDSDVEIEDQLDGTIGIRRDGRYLAAEINGLVRLDREWCRLYEQYFLVRADTIDGLAVLQRHSWTSDDNGHIATFRPQPINFGREHPHESSALAATIAADAIALRRDIAFGGARIRLNARARQFSFEGLDESKPGRPLRVLISDSTGRTFRFSRID